MTLERMRPTMVPAELRQVVVGLQDATEAELRRVELAGGAPYGVPTGLKGTGPVQARLGELVEVDPTTGPVDVKLPVVTKADAGRALTVCKPSPSGESVVVTAVPPATIAGSPDLTLALSWSSRTLVVLSTGNWGILAAVR